MEVVLVILGVLVLALVIGYTHHSRSGQALVTPHNADGDTTTPGARGPSEVDGDRGEYPVHDRGTR